MTLTVVMAAVASAFEVNLTETGAVGDGKTGCTAAFTRALEQAAEAGGGTVHVPTGRFRINT